MLNETRLFREIHEQPRVLRNILEFETGKIQQLAEAIRERQVSHVVIAARGTSDNAARYAKYLLGAVNGLVVALAAPSLFTIFKQAPRFGNSLVVGISQSGMGPDIVAVLAEARSQGALVVAITNSPESELAAKADFVIELRAGREHSIAATKTYTSELLVIALLSACLASNDGMLAELSRIPENVAKTLELEGEVRRVVQRYRFMRECVVIGRGYNYATAFELALKLKELTYTIVEPYSSADFLHGPLALIEHGFPAIVLAPSGAMEEEMRTFMRTISQREAEILAISDERATLELAHIPLELPVRVPEWLSPITTIIPGQIFAMHLADIRNYDPDQPRGLHKVTKTR